MKVENWLLSYSTEELNVTEESDKVELKETPRCSESTKQTGQRSVSATEPVPGRVGLQASFTHPNLPLFKEVNPIH